MPRWTSKLATVVRGRGHEDLLAGGEALVEELLKLDDIPLHVALMLDDVALGVEHRIKRDVALGVVARISVSES